jgi:hypothetical protein
MKRMTLTRAELVAAQMAMGIMWFELEDNPESKPLQSALMKFHAALSAWDGEGEATLVWTPGGESGHSCQKQIPRNPLAWAAAAWINRDSVARHARAASPLKPAGAHNSTHPWYRGASLRAVPKHYPQRA